VNQQQTVGIVLARTDYGEADRIITVLTPDFGKLRMMARGVRKIKSKLAGGIELFSVSDLTFIHGRGEIATLVSARLRQHYGAIVQDITRVQLGYELIKLLNKSTADEPEPEYFELLHQSLEALNDLSINSDLINVWFTAQLLKLGGHTPNLQTDASGQTLTEQSYNFDFDSMAFQPHPAGHFTTQHIKLMRLLLSSNPPQTLSRITNLSNLLNDCQPLIRTMAQSYLHV